MSACEVEESLFAFISSLATRHSPLPFVRSMMPTDSISRRDILRTLAFGAAAGSVLQIIPAEAAEYVHQMVHKEKAAAIAGAYTPKYFTAAQYAALLFLCD